MYQIDICTRLLLSIVLLISIDLFPDILKHIQNFHLTVKVMEYRFLRNLLKCVKINYISSLFFSHWSNLAANISDWVIPSIYNYSFINFENCTSGHMTFVIVSSVKQREVCLIIVVFHISVVLKNFRRFSWERQ